LPSKTRLTLLWYVAGLGVLYRGMHEAERRMGRYTFATFVRLHPLHSEESGFFGTVSLYDPLRACAGCAQSSTLGLGAALAPGHSRPLIHCKNHMSSHELAPSQDGDTSINPRVFHLFEYRLFDSQKEMILISREFFCSFLLLLDALYLLLLVESMILILSAARWLRTLAWTPMLWLVAVNNQYF